MSPWHQWVDKDRYRRHTESVEVMALMAVASAHGPVLRGSAIPDAFDRVRAAGAPRIMPPGQPLLDEIVAAGLAAEAAGLAAEAAGLAAEAVDAVDGPVAA